MTRSAGFNPLAGLHLDRIRVFDQQVDTVAGFARVSTAQWNWAEVDASAHARSAGMVGGPHSYDRADPEVNLVGLIGERAVCQWLRSFGLPVVDVADRPAWRRYGDVAILPDGEPVDPEPSIEVKTAQVDGWRTYGRSLPVAQLGSAAGVYVWCLIEEAIQPSDVVIAGWLPGSEVRFEAVPAWEGHVRVITPMRSVQSLVDPLVAAMNVDPLC